MKCVTTFLSTLILLAVLSTAAQAMHIETVPVGNRSIDNCFRMIPSPMNGCDKSKHQEERP